MRAADAAPM